MSTLYFESDAPDDVRRHRIYDALLAHPLIGQHALADGLTDRLLAANTSWVRP